ncbi:UNVERIFIED_CONTAM: hypothetical protein NCL1_40937 [Trichonephila clavipes]
MLWVGKTERERHFRCKSLTAGWRIPLLKTSPNSHSKPRSMNDLEALKTRQIVAENGLDIKNVSMRKVDRLLVYARKRIDISFNSVANKRAQIRSSKFLENVKIKQ